MKKGKPVGTERKTFLAMKEARNKMIEAGKKVPCVTRKSLKK